MTYDLLVVGLGAMGASVLETAARRGLHVAGVEQYGRVHALGGSHGKARMIRQAYFEDTAYVPLVLRAYELWDALERRSGKSLLRKTGVLVAGRPSSAIVEGVLRSAAEHGLAVESFDAGALRKRFPMFRPLDDEVGAFEVAGGVLNPERALEVQLDLARAAGAQAIFETRVLALREVAGGFECALADDSTITARKIALCAGSWLGELAPQLAGTLEIRRKIQIWFEPRSRAFDAERCPPFLIDRPALGEQLYAFPDFGDGLKAAFHTGGERIALEGVDRNVREEEIAAVRDVLEIWAPGSTGPVRAASVCFYDMTPDENFVLGFLGANPNAIVAGGFSGHGFKFSPAIGEIVVDLAVDGATRHPIDFLAPERFDARSSRSLPAASG
ncbi:MAG: N-methyl-L-tryptophan oxidase [Candidatus Eremiobacteraeota bacterium]|nr:N-methyl-L-tryptophan oxidase [Candidatus Eremiobacteraeota bacterium]